MSPPSQFNGSNRFVMTLLFQVAPEAIKGLAFLILQQAHKARLLHERSDRTREDASEEVVFA